MCAGIFVAIVIAVSVTVVSTLVMECLSVFANIRVVHFCSMLVILAAADINYSFIHSAWMNFLR